MGTVMSLLVWGDDAFSFGSSHAVQRHREGVRRAVTDVAIDTCGRTRSASLGWQCVGQNESFLIDQHLTTFPPCSAVAVVRVGAGLPADTLM